MREYNPEDPKDVKALLMEIGDKAKNAQPLDGDEALMLYGYALGLELKNYSYQVLLYSLGFTSHPQADPGASETTPPPGGQPGDGIIFDDEGGD